MLAVFLLQNQNDQYLSKSGDWLSGADSKALFRTSHKDEAINQKVEISVKQADPRVSILSGFQLPNGQVVLAEDQTLPISNFIEEKIPESMPDAEVHPDKTISTESRTAARSDKFVENTDAESTLAFEFESNSDNKFKDKSKSTSKDTFKNITENTANTAQNL